MTGGCQRRPCPDRPSERGSSVIELTVLTPVVVILLFFVVAAGRVGVIESKLSTAARSAARAATQYGSAPAAEAAAAAAAKSVLAQSTVNCGGGPRVDLLEMNLRPGGNVQIRVSCSVSLSDLTLIALPGHRLVSAQAVSVVDRSRSETT